jgi:PAS domain S-box-containing protein
MALAVPLMGSSSSEPFGALLLKIDPERFLYPLIQFWPVPSRSAETLLVRREGNDVVYLNELRHRRGTALKLRFPVAHLELPAVKAVLGYEGTLEGVDYRGIPVLAATRGVPGSPWFMVAKVDREEVLTPMRQRTRFIAMFFGLAAVTLIAGIMILWSRQEARAWRERHEAELERRAILGHFDYLSHYANDIILLLDEKGGIVVANDRAANTYGYSIDELRTMNIADLNVFQEAGTVPEILEQMKKRGPEGLIFETEHVRRDGSRFLVEVSARAIEVEGRALRQEIVRDITERKRAGEALRESEERYRSLFEQSGDLILLLELRDGPPLILDANQAALRAYGYSREEMVGQPASLLEPGITQELIEERDRLLAEGKPLYMRRWRKDGTVFDVESVVRWARIGAQHAVLAVERDITERKRAEETLRASEERFRRMFHHSAAGMVLVSPDFCFLQVNDAFCKMLGYTESELLGKTFEDVTLPEDREVGSELARRVLSGEMEMFHLEKRYLRKDGTVVWGLVSSTLIRDTQNKPLHFVTQIQDFSERKRAEEELALQARIAVAFASVPDDQMFDEVLKVVLDVMHSPLGVFGYIDKDGAHVAPTMTRQVWSECAVAGKTIRFPRDTWSDSSWPRAYREKRASYSNEVSARVPEGHVGIRRHISVPILFQGEAIGLFQVANKETDYTEEDVRTLGTMAEHVAPILNARLQSKQAGEALRQSEERHRTILQTAMDGFWLTDTEGRLLEVNDAYCRMSGYSTEELLAMRVSDLEANETASDTAVHVQKVLAQGEDRFESRHRRKDGSLFDIETSVQHRQAGGGRFVAFLRDITERKRAEEERERLQLQLAQAQKMESIGRLAGGVAHDFNNQLTVINGYSALALRHTEPGDPRFHGLTEILRAGERAADLVRQLLAFSRRQALQPEILDLNATVGDMEKMLHRLVGEDVEIAVRLDPGIAPILADRHQIEQVIMNLAVNARDAMPGGGTLTLETGQRQLEGVCGTCREQIRPGTYVELTARDTGTGMDAYTLEHMFEPFLTTKGVGRGTGLGLSTVQGIVIQSGGHVEVESELGKGSAFRVHLPVAELPAVRPSALPVADAVGGAETILLVEDQEEVRKFIATILGEYGYKVVQAQDAAQALRLCAAQPVDLLVTDVVMPKMSGVELAERLRLTLPGLRAIFISGYSEDTHAQQRESVPDAGFLQKPFSPEALAKKVREVLEGR